MAQDLREVKDIESLMAYFSEKLGWALDPDDYYDIDDITYDFEAVDLGLKEEAFAKITSLKQLRPLVDNQRWGIFFVNFESNRFEVSALRKILSGLIPSRRNADHAVWDKKDLLFLCTWGERNTVTIGAAYFDDSEKGLPQIKMISCEPSVEDFTQINVFEQRLAKLAWPNNPSDTETWHEAWASAFTTRYRQTIRDAHTLTVRLAAEAQNIRDRILNTLEIETSNGYVHLLFQKFKDTLVHDMTEQQFADMYAQTVVYGLFSARCMDDSQEDFNATEAVECIPNTNPFLKGLLQECLGSTTSRSKLSFDELEVGNIVDLLLHTQTDSIIKDFNRQTGGGREDPVIHFYEEFLSEYDKSQRVQRGVYYTPQPAVNFIVQAVDTILKRNFDVSDGLASTNTKKIKYLRQSKKRIEGYYRSNVEDEMEVPAIQILDPATGTGTFLRQTILQIYKNFCDSRKGLSKNQIQSEWNTYVPQHLLPRLNGFELMMAPYAVAHMKLAMVLQDTGYRFDTDARLQVYLTNSLEKPGNSDAQLTIFDDPLAYESVSANAVKKNTGINVIIGNPPYSGISSNSNSWITEMIEDYKYTNGVYFNERKHWLQDDYVKFIRMSEHLIAEHGAGVLAFINNHSFIDNPTFRSMRWHLLTTFDEIYILDLHGSTKKPEVAPSGDRDENVFDIQQGVSINIFIRYGKKRSASLGTVFHADLLGNRTTKYDWLNNTNFFDVPWEKVTYSDPYYFFIQRDETNRSSWEEGESIKDIMPLNSTGIVTARDALVVDMNRSELIKRITLFADPSKTDDDIRKIFYGSKKAGKYLPGDTRGWSLSKARQTIQHFSHDEIVKCVTYRPFDNRFIYYCPEMVDWGRESLMNTLIYQNNIALVVTRQAITDRWANVFISRNIVDDSMVSNRTKERGYVFPLFLSNGFPNLSDIFIAKMSKAIGIKVQPTRHAHEAFSPFDALCYIYAILYSNKYREKYSDQLKVDFARIPYPNSANYFWSLSAIGEKLIRIHLMENKVLSEWPYYEGSSKCMVKNVTYTEQKIYLSGNENYFYNVSEELWNMFIGGYQPLQKWLKDRKGQELGIDEIKHYSRIIEALRQTSNYMAEIDSVIEL